MFLELRACSIDSLVGGTGVTVQSRQTRAAARHIVFDQKIPPKNSRKNSPPTNHKAASTSSPEAKKPRALEEPGPSHPNDSGEINLNHSRDLFESLGYTSASIDASDAVERYFSRYLMGKSI